MFLKILDTVKGMGEGSWKRTVGVDMIKIRCLDAKNFKEIFLIYLKIII